MSDAPRRRRHIIDKIEVPKTRDVLAEQLRERILDGELAIGERLPTERELVDLTGLSRGSVREALRKLEIEGLVRTRPGRFGGNIITRPDKDSLAQFVGQFVRSQRVPLRKLHEARATIEPALARLAALNRTDEDVAKLRALNLKLSEPKLTPKRFAALNVDWHNALGVASRNELLAAMLYSMSFGVFKATQVETYDSPDVRLAACHIHTRIADAIEAGDGEAAFRRMLRHVEATREKVPGDTEAELDFEQETRTGQP